MIQRELILKAAGLLGETFTASELLVKVWEMAPLTFGLPGFQEKYPDARKLQNILYGHRFGLIANGWIDVAGKKLYRLGQPKQGDAAPMKRKSIKVHGPGLCPGGCGKPVSERERLAYRGRCEDCYSESNARG